MQQRPHGSFERVEVHGRAVIGTAAVALLLAATRWGSQIGAAPLFITDVLIALALVRLVTRDPIKARENADGWAAHSVPSVTFGLFFAYVALRMFVALSEPYPVIDWARDGVPYLYAALAFASATGVYYSTEADRQRTVRLLWIALLAHLVWVSVVAFLGLTNLAQPPLFGVPMFTMRPDIDVAVLAVTAAVATRRWLRGVHRPFHAAVIVLAVAASQMATTRAGLLSVLAALALCFFLHYVGGGSQRRTNMILALPVTVIVLALTLPLSVQGQRLMSSLSLTEAVTEEQLQAQGTQTARSRAWDRVFDWVEETGPRQAFGSGFGNNFLADSRASIYLLGNAEQTDVRSPHNWFIGTYARLGLIGVTAAVLVVLQLLWILMASRRRFAEDELLFIAGTVVVATLPVATLGVVLESPFGAVPFWWCAGVLYAVRPGRVHSHDGRAASGEASAIPQPAR